MRTVLLTVAVPGVLVSGAVRARVSEDILKIGSLSDLSGIHAVR